MNPSNQLTSFLRMRISRIPAIHTTIKPHPRSSFTRTMASNASNPPHTTDAQAQAQAQPAPEQQNSQSASSAKPSSAPLPLPEPSSSDSTQLSVNGEGVKLDHLGPMVVNKDGTLSRIANWDSMADIERQNTLRILGKRNQLRLGNLRDGEAKGE
jgi:hypothetical protein